MTRTAAVLAIALAALTVTPAIADPLPAEAGKSLKAGLPWVSVKLDPNSDAALVHAAIDIPAPAERVWRAMTDCSYAAKMVTNVTRCRVLKQGPGWDIREHVTSGNMFLPAIRNVFRSDYEPYRRIRFHRVDGDLKAMEGEWGLAPLNDGRWTRVTYENRLAARIAAPAFAIRAGLRKDTPKVLENLRRIFTGQG